MSTETTLDLVILGAGPIGLDAALAAAEAGLDFRVLEAGEQIAGAVRRWEHVRLFTPWEMNLSLRMRRALGALASDLPDPDGRPTGGELVAGALEPLAASPALRERIECGARVLGVAREGLLKHEAIGDPERARRRFRIHLATASGPRLVFARRVLDCTGTGLPNPLGDGGIPAPGEDEVEERISRDVPRPEDLASWAGERILLVGAGHSAQTAAPALARLARERPGTEVVWMLRRRPTGPWGSPGGDPLAGRRDLAELSGELVLAPPPGFSLATGVVVDSLEATGDGVAVAFREPGGAPTAPERFDRIVALVGRAPDGSLHRQLQVHECYATEGPMRLAAALLGASGGAAGDCLAAPTPGAETLRTPEPGFFVLGSKSYGRRNDFLLRTGYEQVTQVLGLLDLPDAADRGHATG